MVTRLLAWAAQKGFCCKSHPSEGFAAEGFAATRLALGAVLVDTMVDRSCILRMDTLSDDLFYAMQVGL
jgi:hypothetical protein